MGLRPSDACRLPAWRCLVLLALGMVLARAAGAQEAVVRDVRIEREGAVVTDPSLLALVETKVGAPFSARAVRETIAHLVALDTFDDVRVEQEPLPDGGVRLRYVLVPAHPVDRLQFEGMLGVSQSDLRRTIADQVGALPRAAQAETARQAVLRLLRDHGYPQAEVAVRLAETHNPDRATMVFQVDAGVRARILDLRITHADGGPTATLVERPMIERGLPYERAAVDRALDRWTERMRGRGYYEARASHGVLFAPDGAVVSATLTQGPLVQVAFDGDALSEADRNRLVPIRSEASADEDLLEDSARAIEAFLKQQGHRDARVEFDRVPGEGTVLITFTIDRGPRYAIGAVRLVGNMDVAAAELRGLLSLDVGDVFSEEALGRDLAAVRAAYRARGYAGAQVQARQTVEPPAQESESTRRVDVDIQIAEGPRTVVGQVGFRGNAVLPAATLQEMAGVVPGRPFTEIDVIAARDRLDLEYRNRGYDQVGVQSSVTLAEGDTRADVLFTITEGPQAIVDRVLIVGAVRTNPDVIRREVLLKPGAPLGYSDTVESRARIAALGLFRRVTIEEIPHGVEARRDVLVRVEESPATVIGGGGGLEGAFRLRTDAAGQAVERFEVVPRGFFQVGRRNLWGKNREANLFTRVSVRNRDVGLTDAGTPAPASTADSYGFNEYRVVGTFREPRVFDTAATVLVTGIVEQAIRSSFNFARRELRAEAGLRLSRVYSLSGRYSFERTELFDERFTPDESTLIDRLFPQVRLSTFSGSFIRDSRDDLLDTSNGNLVTVTGDLAARAFGSEVGFTKTYIEAFTFHRLPTARRVVLALAARLGVANGFRRDVARVDASGQPVLDEQGQPIVDVVDTLPAGKRFFAGGDTTVRGFSLDRLGDAKTISASGFPTGGNGVIVLNGELRVAAVGPVQAVGFLDAGNVVARAPELSLGNLRTAAGFGVRFRSPVGPIRLDLGFKLDRRELSPGRLERRSVWHISFGQAF